MDKNEHSETNLEALHNEMVNLYIPTIQFEHVTQFGLSGEKNSLKISRDLGALGFSRASIDDAVKAAFRLTGHEV